MIIECYEPNSSLVIPTQSLPWARTSYCRPDEDDEDDAEDEADGADADYEDECFFHRNLLNEYSWGRELFF